VSLVADINSGAVGSDPTGLTIYNNKLYFGANDGKTGAELRVLDQCYKLTLQTAGPGAGTASSSGVPAGTSCGTSCLAYATTTAVTLTANPHTGSVFDGTWNCTSAFTSGNLLTADTTCTATFTAILPPKFYTFSTATAGTGRGGVTGSTANGSYKSGTTITLAATPATNSVFASWTPATCVNGMTLSADTTCTATFETTPTLTPETIPTFTPVSTPPLPEQLALRIQIDGGGEGRVTTDTGLSCHSSDCQNGPDGETVCNPQACKQVIKTNSIVTLTPLSDPWSVFTSWGGHPDCVGGRLRMSSSYLCIAYFHRIYHLTMTLEGQGQVTSYDSRNQPMGVDCGTTCEAYYTSGMTVYLQAKPFNGMTFAGWRGDCKGGENQTRLPVVVTKDLNCQALFIAPAPVVAPATGEVPPVTLPPAVATAEPTPPPTPEVTTTSPEVTVAETTPTTPVSPKDLTPVQAPPSSETPAVVPVTTTPAVEPPTTVTPSLPGTTLPSTDTPETTTSPVVQPVTATPPMTTPVSTTEPVAPVIQPTTAPPVIPVPTTTPTVPITVTTTAMVTQPATLVSYSCDTSGVIQQMCNYSGETVTTLELQSQGVISNGVLDGTLTNHGWISNFTITTNGKLIGGVVTGYIKNSGVMLDFDFKGMSIIGGTLGGVITNTSKVGGYFQNVTLLPNIVIFTHCGT